LYTLVFYKPIGFSAQTKYYFSADFQLKIFLSIFLDYSNFATSLQAINPDIACITSGRNVTNIEVLFFLASLAV